MTTTTTSMNSHDEQERQEERDDTRVTTGATDTGDCWGHKPQILLCMEPLPEPRMANTQNHPCVLMSYDLLLLLLLLLLEKDKCPCGRGFHCRPG